MQDLVSTEWLASELGAPDLVVLDASWHMPSANRHARAEYEARHISGARFFDIDALSDHDSDCPHMLPSAELFGCAMGDLGVGSGDRIVIYDDSALRTSARAWFMLRHFGALQVAILDGGLAKWVAEGRPTERGCPAERVARFDVAERPGEVVHKDEVRRGTGLPIVDARGAKRFTGEEADPRPGVAPGHMPGARNLPYAAMYRDDGTFRSPEELQAAFAGAGVDPTRPFVASCGSGVTANSLIFAAHLLGNDRTRLYDGSWSEWGADAGMPKELGPAA
ncbi:3-mercaptopyruvate sulfurtransferase [Sphingomonas sp. BN140010]|uniref:3-mercaptopyruvate sulfurtransferase n=1 Tax=Sphingomonas arvum TaxID=2992113 RepID=A0ABT3JBM0_9SPHN|nr:3-mercaptopyruvate sulfurtransferase [Sphingomonas sp. BN140010]MCW3796464.1 3-mercaptopyruvate sulfurtransferase [Sphingomonas sp. BN140010]